MLIGREGAEQNCNVEIDEGTVSGRHCEITLGAFGFNTWDRARDSS